MKLFNLSTNIIVITFLFNVIYTAYFGWNLEPVNETEKFLDVLCTYMFQIGLALFIIPGLKLYKYNIKRYEKIQQREKKRKEKDILSWDKNGKS